MKRIIGLLLFSLLVTNSFAQTDPTVVLPQSPVIPGMTTVTPNELTSSAESTTNKVYIDQSGNNPNVNITQTGQSNNLGISAIQPFVLRGDNQNFVSLQTGNSNSITGGIYGGAVGINTTIQQIGNSNTIDFNCGAGTNANCDRSTFNWNFVGNSNALYYNGGGANQNSAINTNGNNNTINMNVLAPNAAQNLQITGDFNNFNVTQTNGGATGHSLGITLIGTGNTFTTSQTGTVDNVINIKAISNNGTFTVKQGN
jgi:hypothetical protein